MKPIAFLLFLGIFCFPVEAISQKEMNQLDDEGNAHGIWKKYYEGSKQLRYEGKFKHGKEVGEFRFYCEDCKDKPEVIKDFKGNVADVKYLTKKGKIISEGKMEGKQRIGEWLRYHKNSKTLMTRENYSNGKLDGKRLTYYPDGKITEELLFSNGLKEGENLHYSPAGVIIKKLQFKDDKLQGPASFYDGHGNLIIEGAYKEDRKNGSWKYYKNGEVVLEESFPKKNRE